MAYLNVSWLEPTRMRFNDESCEPCMYKLNLFFTTDKSRQKKIDYLYAETKPTHHQQRYECVFNHRLAFPPVIRGGGIRSQWGDYVGTARRR